MAYSQEVVKRARARLAQARDERERENRDHLSYAYQVAPRLKEIDCQLRRTMADAAKAVFSGGNAQTLMDDARKENQSLQQERQWILDTTFEDGFLDESPICEICGGTGYVGSSMCECLQELCRQEQRKELTSLSGSRETFEQFRLEYYPAQTDPRLGVSPRAIMEKTLQTCKKYADAFTLKSENLLFSGNTGLGKTFLSACIAKTVSDLGYSVVYESSPILFSCLERARFEGNEDNRTAAQKTAQKYDQCDLLIVDDLGTELAGQFVTSALYAVVNGRLQHGLPTIISTNLSVEDFGSRYSPQIASRLRGSYRRVAFVGEDIRLIKNRG